MERETETETVQQVVCDMTVVTLGALTSFQEYTVQSSAVPLEHRTVLCSTGPSSHRRLHQLTISNFSLSSSSQHSRKSSKNPRMQLQRNASQRSLHLLVVPSPSQRPTAAKSTLPGGEIAGWILLPRLDTA